MLRFDEIAFGPIFSRRLGSSLGVNILPPSGKLCNFDCIYCELGWNRDGVTDGKMPSAEMVKAALDSKLAACSAEGTAIDSITFSGNGEPTLNPEFPQIVDVTLELRDKYYPEAKVTVFSNSTTLKNPGITAALSKVDWPVLKVDAVSLDGVSILNKPSGRWDIETIKAGMKALEGRFLLQTMFLKSPEFDSADGLEAWMSFVREVRPKHIMVYTIDRETPQKDLRKYTVAQMTEMVQPLIAEGFDVQIRG